MSLLQEAKSLDMSCPSRAPTTLMSGHLRTGILCGQFSSPFNKGLLGP